MLLLLVAFLLTIPAVQTFLGGKVTDYLRESMQVDVNVERLSITPFGSVKLKTVLIKDHHQDTLIYAKQIQTKIIGKRALLKGNLIFGDLSAEELKFYLTTYKGEEESSIGVFVEKFSNDNKEKSTEPFVLNSSNLKIANGRFRVTNQNAETPISVDFRHLNADLDNFSIVADKIDADILHLSMKDHRGVFVDKMKAKVHYSSTNISLEDLDVQTLNQTRLIGSINMDYNEGDLSAFTDKVNIDAQFGTESKIAAADINYFYPELNEELIFNFSTHIKGVLNEFRLNNLFLNDGQTILNGTLEFKNLTAVNERDFSISGNVTELNTSNEALKNLLPRVLGQTFPPQLDNLGRVVLRNGILFLDKNNLSLKSNIATHIGNLVTDLHLQNIADPQQMTYQGKVSTINFGLGQILNNNALGRITSELDIKGKGTTQATLDAYVDGAISSIHLNGYDYKKIILRGKFKEPYFEGEAHIDDKNLKLSFEGLLNLGAKQNKYDFRANVDYADLYQINLIERDTLSVLKGEVLFVGQGNTLDEIQGFVNINNASYQNQNDTYYFEDFQINCNIDQDGVRSIIIDSHDIIEGELIGRYNFGELPKIFQNALGSLYTNYSPFKIRANQFLKFNFSIYNKIVEVFFPSISFGNNTFIKGDVNPDKEVFKFNFQTPKLQLADNKIHRIDLQIDNKNPIYNAYIEMDSIENPYYKISDFGVINIKRNDTLHFRTEFKGGATSQDYYNFNTYYTIDQEQRSVFGFKKSELHFKDYLWHINNDGDNLNKIIFNQTLDDFQINDIELSHNEQNIFLTGAFKGKNKLLNLDFQNVNLSKIIPEIENFDLEGLLNGNIFFRQEGDAYTPTSSIAIDGLSINNTLMGDLTVDIQGDDTLERFGINSYLYKNSDFVMSLEGDLEIKNKETYANMDLRLDKFDISPFSAFGGDIITNLRGLVSGRTTILGNIQKPDINGRVFLDKAGMKLVYLNTDFAFDNNTIVDITEDVVIMGGINLTDTKYGTKAILSGEATHKMFTDWQLDLYLSSNKMLVLDTEYVEDVMYYGTAFINGNASIRGPVSALVIRANVTSEEGTHLYIPIGDSKSTGEVSYIKFVDPKENQTEFSVQDRFSTMGMELHLMLRVTPVAKIDIIIDKDSGHAIREGHGNGQLELDINTLGTFTMNGLFTVEGGYYDFKYGGIISKRFNVKKGGTISWTGNPILANMNIEGIYTTDANPAVLLENPSFNRKIPVELVIDIKGTLEALQEPNFQINFPSVSSVLQSEIQYKLTDADTRRTQAFYLLLTRNFLGQTGAGSGALAGSLTETASGLFNGLLTEGESVFDVSVDYTVASKNPNSLKDVEDSDRVNMSLSTQINENITINGKVGVPVGGTRQSAVVGNVEVLYRLNKDRTFNVRGFNRENDVNYFGEGIGYTQGVGITWDVDFDNYEEFAAKIFGSKKHKRKEEDTELLDLDSEFNPEYRKFIQERAKKRQSQKDNDKPQERVPDPF
ncbi:MAG: translocation/assembly module TamB domain-containing protein [Bacteroidota bacterium]|nr:translocation/assembly module TamB domain-containing protein [Bacteroidota bacterium]